MKLPPVQTLSLGARLTVQRHDGTFAVAGDLYIPAIHVAPLDHVAGDFVSVAEMFAATPYLWGGKTSLGIDCSGLVQVALNASGIACPRDSDMQEQALGRTLSPAETQQPRRGDLMFWKGHVAIVRSATTLIHANAHHMATAIEPIHEAIARINAAGGGVTSVKRLG
jgi:cell wall-associated NlpC family hydrolase